jgi:UDP-N-acetylmuramoyl-L-alanyl-D-glutamate--2,6-diaminopimelate ligase
MKKLSKKLKTFSWRIKSLFARYYYGNPSRKLKVVGVTGTNGKTTTATLLYQIATALGYKAGLIGTAGNIVAGEKREATHTTPDSITLTKLLKDMVDAGCEYVFMEVSSHALHQGRVAGVYFVGGIFTNLTHDHLDYHKSITNYFLAKKKFFQMLPASAFALTNSDDEHGLLMQEGIRARKFSYGFLAEEGRREDFHGELLKFDFTGLEIRCNGELIHSKLLGKFNAYNTLSVWSAAKLLGFDMDTVRNIFKTIEPPVGRFDFFVSHSGVVAIVDYAHTPDALENVLQTVQGITEPRSKIICVFGCGGDRDPMKRRIMGKIGAQMSDMSIFTSDNPRGEKPMSIIEEMQRDLSMQESNKITVIEDRHEAIREAVRRAREHDVILVAGKGHETYQEIKGVKYRFNDREELEKAFKEASN